MKNLALLKCLALSTPRLADKGICLAVDGDTGRIYFNTQTDVIGIDTSIDEETFLIGLEELAQGDTQIAGLQFLQGEESLCIATKQGDLLLVNVQTRLVECVGSVESGLREMRWSPDQTLVLLATGHDTVIEMTREFDAVSEVDVHAKEFGQGEFINVGWGKKETQFHGSEGKGAATQRKVEIEPALPWDDCVTRIVWRGDGQYFAVSMIDPDKGNRKFRVWNKECVLQYTSEYMNGLESAFAWRPSGNLLASSQRKPHRHDIVFFETNGLQHGEFTLPFKKDQMQVKHLEWNSDSTVLVIWLTSLQPDGDGNLKNGSGDCVQLWTMSNYHWYLKQNFQFDEDQPPVCVQWDADQSYKLHVLCKNGRYMQFVFQKVTNHSNLPTLCRNDSDGDLNGECVEKEEMSFVAVIDGKNVLMTPFKVLAVPPPMCAYKLQLSHEANAVAFCSSKSFSGDVAIVMKNERVALFTTGERESSEEIATHGLSVKLDAAGGNGFKSQVVPHKPLALLKIEANGIGSVAVSDLHHWLWLNPSQMFSVTSGSLPGTDTVILFDIDLKGSKLTIRSSSTIADGQVLSVHLHSSNCVALQLHDGTMLKCQIPSLETAAYTSTSGLTLKLPRPCLQVASCSFLGTPCVVGLSEHYRLYVNQTEIASDCSSFCIHNDFLFLTTNAHQLRCIFRNVALDDIIKYFSTPLEGRSVLRSCSVVETHRALERGSKIVTVTPSDSRLVLQMPRGNLELIHPRCLVLSSVTGLIETLQYGKAFTIMKKHRINMNLLHDIDSNSFKANVASFISELESIANLNIFISDLQNEDLTQTMYSQYFVSDDKDNSLLNTFTTPADAKINTVCKLLLEEMEKSDQKYIASIVTAHVKKQPSEVGNALKNIKSLADKIGHDEKPVSDALKIMTVLVDGNTLFNEALGTYDFKLMLMVAEKSQLDPKEFLPMLRELQQMEENYRKYRIDVNLRRYSSALGHILGCEKHFDECMELIVKHQLYREALKLVKANSERFDAVCRSYGEFLSSKNKHEEAGIVFTRCHDTRRALECFSYSSNYSLCLMTASKLEMERGELVELAYKLAEKAKASGDHSEAVEILEHHACDIELAVEAALHANLWSKAIRIAEQHGRADLIETNAIPAIKEAQERTCQSLISHRDLIVKHTTRLQAVRQLKEKQKMQALLDGVEGIGFESDLYSDTSSTMAGSVISKSSSTATRSTGRTAKSRKKKERRAYSLKQGSRFEDLALLHSLKIAIKAVDDLSDDVRSLGLCLSLLRLEDLAETVQTLYLDVRASVGQLVPTIWSPTVLQSDTVTTGPQSTVNSIVASMRNRRSPMEQGSAGEEHQRFADVELFVPPKFEKTTSWMMDLFSR